MKNETLITTWDEMQAARKRGEEIWNGWEQRVDNDPDWSFSVSNAGILNGGTYFAKPAKPKEFDFWTAMQEVYAGNASKACYGIYQSSYFTRVEGSLLWRDGEFLRVIPPHVHATWHLYDNEGNVVTE